MSAGVLTAGALATAMLLATSVAPASAASPLRAGWIDHDAAIVIKASPRDIEALAEIAGDPASPLAGPVRLVRMLATAAVGFDVASPDRWHAAGFDSSLPFFIQVAAIERAQAKRTASALAAANEWTADNLAAIDKTFWRSRLVFPIRSAEKARGTLAALQRVPGLEIVTPGRAKPIATLLGETPRGADKLASTLAGERVFLVGRVQSLDALIFARTVGDALLVVDVLSAFGDMPVAWQRDGKELLSLIRRGSDRRGFSERVRHGAALELERPGLAAWISPARILDLVYGLDATEQLRNLPQASGRLGSATGLMDRSCPEFEELASSGGLVDAALRVHVGKQLTLRARWGLRTGFGLASALETVDDGLPDPQLLPALSFAGAVYLKGTAALRKLPRPAAFAGSWEGLWARVRLCRGGEVVMALVGWPLIASLFLDEVAALDPDARVLIDSLRNFAFGFERLSWHSSLVRGAGEVSMARRAEPIARRYLRTVFGRPSRHGTPREHVTWGRGPIRPYAFELPVRAADNSSAMSAVGFALGGVGVRWRLNQKTGRSAQKRPIARFVARADTALAELGAAPIGRLLSVRYGASVRAQIAVERATLSASLTLDRTND